MKKLLGKLFLLWIMTITRVSKCNEIIDFWGETSRALLLLGQKGKLLSF